MTVFYLCKKSRRPVELVPPARSQANSNDAKKPTTRAQIIISRHTTPTKACNIN